MIDEEPYVEAKPVAADEGAADPMLYDFAKFVTTLSLIVLGGVLSLTQASGHVPNKNPVMIVAGFIAFACLLSISAAATLAGLYPRRWSLGLTPKWTLNIALFILSVGTGGFIGMWQKSL